MLTSVALLGVALIQAPQAQGNRPPIEPPRPTAEALANDTGALRHPNGRTPPVAHARRLTGPAPRIDGKLDDAAWASAEPITDLWQSEPHEGQPASERTEVRILYDDDAIYIAAHMFDREPGLIRTQLGRRDNTGVSDALTISLDSYHDHRTAFQFGTNPSGVKVDAISSGDNNFGDAGWDPVWDLRTSRDSTGWTAEMRIPLSQLRYSRAAVQTWGINVERFIQRKAESALFAWKGQTDEGYASRFGHLFGLENLPQPRRLEALPYVVGRNQTGASIPGDPFHDGSRANGAAGMDLKYGITSNLTLDATINPDFGQVEQDPAYVNLSAFEQYLQERRPFFVEGADIFEFGGQQFFYSRRIGSPPHGSADSHAGFVDQPDNSTILGAAKLTGRTSRGWSVGLLEALTAREYGTIDSSGVRFRDEVEPLTNYLVTRVKRDMHGGASSVGAMFTAVNRDLRDTSLRFLRRAAYTGGLDFSHRFARNTYALSGAASFSSIRGDTTAIQGAQLSSARYYQRPDVSYVQYDPARTSLGGFSGNLTLARIQGNWTWRARWNASSPGMEINDAGFGTRADQQNVAWNLQHRWTRPGKLARSAQWGLDLQASWNFGGMRTANGVGTYGYLQFLNYWSLNASQWLEARSYSDVLTRGGPVGVNPAGANWFLGVNSDFRKPWQFFLGSSYFTNEIGSFDLNGFANISLRPSASVNLSFNPSIGTGRTVQQFLGAQDDPLNPAMYGRQYLFAAIRQRYLDFTTRLNVTFSPSLSLQFFAQPFVATGAYEDFKELSQPRTTQFIRYGRTPGSTKVESRDPVTNEVVSYTLDPDGNGPRPSFTVSNPDFSVRSLRGNAVLRWEYRPGSTLFLVWTQSCGASDQRPRFQPGVDLRQLCQGVSDNAFALKVNYWLSL